MSSLKFLRQGVYGIVLFSVFVFTASAADTERVIISCGASCSSVASGVTSLGGTVTQQFKYIDAIAAIIPSASREAVMGLSGVARVQKDVIMAAPEPLESVDLEAAAGTGAVVGGELAGLNEPADYLFNNDLIGASTMHANGDLGDAVIVGVIDSGTAHASAFSRFGCPTDPTGPTVIGGETYIAGAPVGEPSATSFSNGAHGTWVGTTIAANAGFLFLNGSAIATAVATYAPGSAFVDFPVPGLTLIPMVGVAPCANIYALKVFSAFGGGAPNSDVIAAMERAIELKENFDAGMPSTPVSGDGSPEDPFVYDSLNIQVVNMSLGGATLYAGNALDDLVTETMLAAGITIVHSSGNEGHAAMTGGSAGTGRGTITTAAASTAAHERILRDLQFGPGVGAFYRPFDGIQTVEFSSRGPSADGRISTNVTSNGLAMFAQAASGALNLVSGTSFSSPTVAGAAALLRGANPGASANQIRNAIIEGADPNVLADGSGPIDQGNGFLDIPAANALLASGSVGNGFDTGTESASVKGNINSVGMSVVNLGNSGYSTTAADLLPGQVAHIFIDIKKDTDQVTIDLSNLVRELPPVDQNAFFGDDLFVRVQDATTSDEDYLVQAFLNADATFVLDNPQTGIMRLAIQGDWTNAGRISVDVGISRVKSPQGKKTAQGKIAQNGFDFEDFNVPAGTAELVIELSWNNNWGAYPTDDLDMFLLTPSGGIDFSGATFASPERVVIANPEAGTWTAVVNGFTVWGVHGSSDSHYEVRARADGNHIN